MFLHPFTRYSEGGRHIIKKFDKKNGNNMLMQHSTNFLKRLRLNMSITCLIFKNKMHSLNVIIKLWWKQQEASCMWRGCWNYLWEKITNIIVHVLNRAMTWILDELTPFESIGDRLDILHFWMFGYFMYKHILKELWKKLDLKNKKMIFSICFK